MKDRCAGSLTAPTEVQFVEVPPDYIDRLLKRKSTKRQVGSCRTCGAWISLQTDGMLRPHVNWDLRRLRLEAE